MDGRDGVVAVDGIAQGECLAAHVQREAAHLHRGERTVEVELEDTAARTHRDDGPGEPVADEVGIVERPRRGVGVEAVGAAAEVGHLDRAVPHSPRPAGEHRRRARPGPRRQRLAAVDLVPGKRPLRRVGELRGDACARGGKPRVGAREHVARPGDAVGVHVGLDHGVGEHERLGAAPRDVGGGA